MEQQEVKRPASAWARIYYQGQRPRTGKLFEFKEFEMSEVNGQPAVVIAGHLIRAIIEEKFPKSNLFQAFYYHEEQEGFVELEDHSQVHGYCPPSRVNIVLEPNVHEPYSPVDTIMLRAIQSSYCPDQEKDKEDSELATSQPRTRTDPAWRDFEDKTGWYGIGIVRGKTEPNHGTLWRSAFQMGAAFAFSIGARYEKNVEDCANVNKMWAKTPFLQYPDWDNFVESAPYACPWVAVEMGGVPLPDFVHPTRAIYFLGSEDTGLPSSIVDHCHFHVSIPSVRSMSYNVSVAGSIIMYDRLQKQQVQIQGNMSPELESAIEEYQKEVKKSRVEEVSEPSS